MKVNNFFDNVEFISYELTMDDPYAIGIATVKLYDMIIIRLKLTRMKDGRQFLAKPSFQLMENGEKRSVEAFFLDSQLKDKQLIDYVKEQIKKLSPQPQIVEETAPF